jgi:ribosomal RNA-processing protein 36
VKSEDEDEQVQAQISKVSFGALAKAQDALSKQEGGGRKRKRGDESSKSQDDKLQALRLRLQQIKAAKLAEGPPPKKTKSGKRAARDEDEASDDEASEGDAAPRARSSKHAPAVQSSKKAVSRKRKIVDTKKSVSRDPRFDNISGPGPDENTVNKRYAFLNDYKASEMAELKAAIKKTKNEADKEKLKKKLTSMESQEKARARKEQQQEVIHEHKKKEKELVKQGKTPFFLKKCEYLLDAIHTLETLICYSRAKEDCTGQPLPEHEVKGPRPCHRTASQEVDSEGAEKYAHGTAGRLNSSCVSVGQSSAYAPDTPLDVRMLHGAAAYMTHFVLQPLAPNRNYAK